MSVAGALGVVAFGVLDCSTVCLFVRMCCGCHVSLMIQVSHLSGPGVVLGKSTRIGLLVGLACSDHLNEPDLALGVDCVVKSSSIFTVVGAK